MLGLLAVSVACAGVDPDTTPPSAGSSPAPMASDAPTAPGEPITAEEIDETTTGLRGAIAAGLWPGDPSDPYAALRRYRGEVVIDEEWLGAENGGSRLVEGIEVEGNLVVLAPGVSIRYCRVVGDPGANYAVQANREDGDARDLEISWCEIDHANHGGKAVLLRSGTLRRLDVAGGEDGIHVNDAGPAGPLVIDETYVHDQFRPPEHHSDAVQFNGDPGGPVTITRSKLISHFRDANAPLMLSGVDEIEVVDTYLWGGVYFVVGGVDGRLEFHDNRLGWKSTEFGAFGVSEGRVVYENNTWAPWIDPESIGPDGEPVTLRGPDPTSVPVGQLVEPSS